MNRLHTPPSGTSVTPVADDPGVHALPSTEPITGERPALVVASGAPPPSPVPEYGVPVPARRSAHAIVLMALEVVDRRRAPQQTRGAFPAHLVEMLQSLARTGVPGRDLGPARIHRLHVNAAGPAPQRSEDCGDDGYTDYEVCATYARGPRLFAVAARIRVTATGATCTALRLV